jgi:hypothetical protein
LQCGLLLQAGLHSMVSLQVSLAASQLIPHSWSCPHDRPSPLQVWSEFPEHLLPPGLHVLQTPCMQPLGSHESRLVQTPLAPQVWVNCWSGLQRAGAFGSHEPTHAPFEHVLPLQTIPSCQTPFMSQVWTSLFDPHLTVLGSQTPTHVPSTHAWSLQTSPGPHVPIPEQS